MGAARAGIEEHRTVRPFSDGLIVPFVRVSL
jgi:hypothetical protein